MSLLSNSTVLRFGILGYLIPDIVDSPSLMKMAASSFSCKERVGYLETVIIMGAIVTLCHTDWNALQSTVGGVCTV